MNCELILKYSGLLAFPVFCGRKSIGELEILEELSEIRETFS